MIVNTDDETLARRIRDIVAVAAKDIDGVRIEVEDGVAYLEGVVSSAREARSIVRTVARLRGLCGVVTWLSTEKVLANKPVEAVQTPLAPAVLMHYHSLS
jgi:osmotically-inducible protein OsmY